MAAKLEHHPTFKAFANTLARFFPICRFPFSISEISADTWGICKSVNIVGAMSGA
jgi:hypothetical protein